MIGLIHQLRMWHEQFHADVGDIEKDMVEPKEVEVDMTKALAAWEAEQARLK